MSRYLFRLRFYGTLLSVNAAPHVTPRGLSRVDSGQTVTDPVTDTYFSP